MGEVKMKRAIAVLLAAALAVLCAALPDGCEVVFKHDGKSSKWTAPADGFYSAEGSSDFIAVKKGWKPTADGAYCKGAVSYLKQTKLKKDDSSKVATSASLGIVIGLLAFLGIAVHCGKDCIKASNALGSP